MEEQKCKNPKCDLPKNSEYAEKSKEYCKITCYRKHLVEMKLESWIRGEWSGSTESNPARIWTPIREFLLEKAGNKCSQCGWNEINPSTKKVPLEIDHTDGDSENHSIDNLKVLCPNCHSLTPTYKSLNWGKSKRANRKLAASEELFKKRAERVRQIEINKQRKLENKRTKPVKVTVCACGGEKHKGASQCIDCHLKEVNAKSDSAYPPIQEMILVIHRVGVLPYAKHLGKSDNAIRKHLISRGVEKSELRKKPEQKNVFCFCGKSLSIEEIIHASMTCTEHAQVKYKYPPTDEIVKGVEEFGWHHYARSIGVNHTNSMREYLQRQGVDTTKLSKLE